MSTKPSAIIFGEPMRPRSPSIHCIALTSRLHRSGGLNTCSRALAALLVPIDGEPLVSVRLTLIPGHTERLVLTISSQHLRIVDKYSVSPPTTYVLEPLDPFTPLTARPFHIDISALISPRCWRSPSLSIARRTSPSPVRAGAGRDMHLRRR